MRGDSAEGKGSPSPLALSPLPFQNKSLPHNLTIQICIPPQGHSSFITHLDWSVDSQYLVSNSGDYEILYCECFTAYSSLIFHDCLKTQYLCRLPQGSPPCVNRWSVWRLPETLTGPPTPALWASVCLVRDTSSPFLKYFLSLSLTFDLSPLSSGLWPDGSDGTDVNAVCRSHDKSLLVTGDDFGKVHLFTYPCSQFRVRYYTHKHTPRHPRSAQGPRNELFLPHQAPSHLYSGHSSHVTNVGFLHDDSCLVSIGGKDMSVMQWRIV